MWLPVLLRTIFERLARGRVVWRRLPNGESIAISPDAQLKYLYARFDQDLIGLARENVTAGMTVWDIGANCGTFSFSCDQAETVVAVEADSFLAGLLRRSAAKSKTAVDVIEAAVSDRDGTAEFTIAARGRASNHLSSLSGYSQTGGERGRVTVSTITLDTILAERGPPDFIKIDIEGAEPLALRGASRLLAEARPIIYLEVTEDTEIELRDVFERADYELCDLGGNWLAKPR
ncbi:MAG: FkbM family methyltransferase [Sphingomicrobium sp.]